MKKIIFIIPFFGKFNNYFELFLNSCKYNSEIDWLIITDDHTKYNYPSNVKVEYTTLDILRKNIQEKFDFCISLEKPYKLCDYKPCYGYIFDKFIQKYDFWGFCDTDLIFGNIKKFLTIEILNKYNKIGFYGHMTLFKNNEKNNKLFMQNNRYKEVLSNPENFIFDEEFDNSINNIYLNLNEPIYLEQKQANLYVKTSDFKLTEYDFNKNGYVTEKKKQAFFVWEKGNLKRIVLNNKKYEIKEYLYIHMQKRKMMVKTQNKEVFKIIPNAFEDVEKDYFQKKYNNVKIKHMNLHYFVVRWKNLKEKINKIKGK